MTLPAERATVLSRCAMTDSLDPLDLNPCTCRPLRVLANFSYDMFLGLSPTLYAFVRFADYLHFHPLHGLLTLSLATRADPAATARNSDTPPS